MLFPPKDQSSILNMTSMTQRSKASRSQRVAPVVGNYFVDPNDDDADAADAEADKDSRVKATVAPAR